MRQLRALANHIFMRKEILKGSNDSMSATEKEIEKALRPLSFEDFAGQDKVVENLRVFVTAARGRAGPWTTCCCTALRFGQNHAVAHYRQ